MRYAPSEREGHEALRRHMLERAAEARGRFGPRIGAAGFLRMLADARFVRYPTVLCFDAQALGPGEFVRVIRADGEAGRQFSLCLHPRLASAPASWPLGGAYVLPVINYGPVVTDEDCLLFGAALLGLTEADYCRALCRL